ncbi:MAG: hypothetical protein MZW92_02280 [Comamonadaceae bacterium]|nr:hypothetical protein [Comamonadaceae bacterium]
MKRLAVFVAAGPGRRGRGRPPARPVPARTRSPQRPAQEEFLLTAEIVASEPIGEGVTKPYKLYSAQGRRRAQGRLEEPERRAAGLPRGLAVRDRRLPPGQAHRA